MISFEDSFLELASVPIIVLIAMYFSSLILLSALAVHGLKEGLQSITPAGKATAILITLMLLFWGGSDAVASGLMVFVPAALVIWNLRYCTPTRIVKLLISIALSALAYLLLWIPLSIVLLLIPENRSPFGDAFDYMLYATLIMAMILSIFLVRSSVLNDIARRISGNLFVPPER